MDAGVLLTTVCETKPSVRIGDHVTPSFIGVDSSHNQLVNTVIYNTQHPIVLADRATAPADHSYHVVGHLMQGGDVLAHARTLPEVTEGDVLVVGKVGGYAACRATPSTADPGRRRSSWTAPRSRSLVAGR